MHTDANTNERKQIQIQLMSTKVTRLREKGACDIEAGWESNRKSGIAIWKQFEN